MLKWNEQDFTSGSARFFDEGLGAPEPTPKVYVRVGFPTAQRRKPTLAQLDTGAARWRGETFLGYTGLLDKLRIALDSPANQFYFGQES